MLGVQTECSVVFWGQKFVNLSSVFKEKIPETLAMPDVKVMRFLGLNMCNLEEHLYSYINL